jgi:diguanylate cyclase (GGDEF)-like protein
MDATEEVSPKPYSARLSIGVAAFGITWVALHAAGWLDPEANVTFAVFAVLSVVGTVVGIRRYDPQPRWPWLAFLAAFALFLVGGVIRIALGTLGDLSADRSLVPDLIILPGYAVLAIAVYGVARAGRRGRQREVDALLDAVIAALAVLILAWVYLITPAMEQDVPTGTQLLLTAYPPASVFVVAMGARMAFNSARRPPIAMRLLLSAALLLTIGDVVYMLVDAGLADLPTNVIDVPYVLAYVAVTCAILHPSVRQIGQTLPSDDVAPRRGRLLFVAVALSVPALVLVTPAATSDGDRYVVAVLALALTATASARMFRALHQHATSQARLAHQATHDDLTGLPNRLFVQEHLARVLDTRRHEASSVAVLLLDLDRFKLVNDTMGHSTGDELLVAVAERLQRNVRATDVVGRTGGDEFVVVVHGVRDDAHALETAERTRLALHTPFTVRGAEIPVATSVGVALHRPGSRAGHPEGLLRDADTAMYQAKDRGGDTVVVFDDSMRERVAERLMLERELRQALARDQLTVHYQPKLRLSDRRVVGMEALLRWNHPDLGFVAPDEFIPIAEDTGMIVEIGAWVLDQACAQLAKVRDELARPDLVTISVNLSVRQLRDGTILDHVARSLLRHGVPAGSLCLELTESMLMADVDHLSSHLAQLRACGVKVSIDDFGTGYSSLAYLRRLPIDEVKIDRSFVWDLDEQGPGASMVSAVVAIAGSLGITTVAEGVETEAQLEQLHELGCDEGQGYLFSRPVPADQLLDVLRDLGCASPPRLRAVTPAS